MHAPAAGVGTDPRDRVFNIIKQAKDYDPQGEYVRMWVPEVEHLPAAHVHHPWTLPQEKRGEYGELENYPEPVIRREEWSRQTFRKEGTGSKIGGNKHEKAKGRR
jgi:deoxyribodipyrimidine photo-lyase